MPMTTRIALTILALFTTTASADPANTCTDPYWKTTLRCTLFPNEIPQPNLHQAPALAKGQPVPPYTRVFLEDEDVRCTDGTRPLLYVDKAICTSAQGCGPGIQRGDAIESNRWLFTFTGGDSCNGERCAFFYAQPDERGSMGTSGNVPLRELDGILDPDPARNPVFAAYNRVRVEKCSFDRYMGRTEETAIQATLPNGQSITFDAYHHGFRILQEALATLQYGLHYRTWQSTGEARKRRACCGAGTGNDVSIAYEALPPLAEAQTVLFIGHSNASHGLYHNIDYLAAELAGMPGFNGDVRAFFDENFQPSVENEAAFAPSAPANSDLYSAIWSGTSSARGETFTYDGATYHATNAVDAEYAAHGAQHDASCVEAHPSTAWMCRDRLHVLFNHVATPFFVRQDLSDPNRDHLDAPDGYWVRWGNAASYTYCKDAQPCEPRFNPAEFRARLEKQAQTLLASAWTRSELARAVDKTPGPLPTYFVWMPDCGQHDGAYTDNPFYDVTIATNAASFTLRTWLEEFLAAPRSGVRRYQIDDALDGSGRRMNTTRCQ